MQSILPALDVSQATVAKLKAAFRSGEDTFGPVALDELRNLVKRADQDMASQAVPPSKERAFLAERFAQVAWVKIALSKQREEEEAERADAARMDAAKDMSRRLSDLKARLREDLESAAAAHAEFYAVASAV